MNLSHDQVRRDLRAAADGSVPADSLADLERHLAECAECRAYARDLDSLDARLSRALQARWPEEKLSHRELDSVLRDIQDASRRTQLESSASSPLRRLALTGIFIALAALFVWGIRNLAPRPAADIGISPTSTGLSPAKEASRVARTNTPESALETPAVQSPPEGQVGLFPGLTFQFAADFPVVPEQLTVYSQQLPAQLSSESARQMAEQLGIVGNVYAIASEGFDETLFEVSDGFDVLRFMNFAEQFVYFPQIANQTQESAEQLPFDQQVEVAKAFLEEHGLLNFPYRAEPLEGESGGIRFLHLVDGIPVIYGIGQNRGLIEWIRAFVDDTGQISELYYSAAEFQPVGQFPILSAQRAWERLSSPQALERAQYAVQAPLEPSTLRSWNRSLPIGEPIELYGYVTITIAADPGAPPALWFNNPNLPLSGEVQYLINQSPAGEFLHLWGQLEENQAGKRLFIVSAWEVSSLPEEFLTGVMHRKDGQAQLLTEDGRALLLADIPQDVPDGSQVEARGVVLPGEPATLDWFYLSTGMPASGGYGADSTCLGGGGGGGGDGKNSSFGGGSFALPNLSGQPLPPPTQAPASLQVGQRAEGMVGTVNVALFQSPGADQRKEISIWVHPSEGIPQSQEFLLEGELPEEIDSFHSLPVQITGEIARYRENRPVIKVESFEPLYPGLKIEAWIGVQEAVTLEEQPALLLHTEDGRTFVLKYSIGSGEESRVGLPGDRVIIEGLAIPGQAFGGYPVLQEMAAGIAGEDEDLNSYQITSNQPVVVGGEMMGGPDLSAVEGTVTIDHVELVYSAVSLRHCTADLAGNPEVVPYLYVQPVWRFRGAFEDGRLFEVQIQALPDEYLR